MNPTALGDMPVLIHCAVAKVPAPGLTGELADLVPFGRGWALKFQLRTYDLCLPPWRTRLSKLATDMARPSSDSSQVDLTRRLSPRRKWKDKPLLRNAQSEESGLMGSESETCILPHLSTRSLLEVGPVGSSATRDA